MKNKIAEAVGYSIKAQIFPLMSSLVKKVRRGKYKIR